MNAYDIMLSFLKSLRYFYRPRADNSPCCYSKHDQGPESLRKVFSRWNIDDGNENSLFWIMAAMFQEIRPSIETLEADIQPSIETVCPVEGCDKTFKNSSHLSLHKAKVHGIEVVSSFAVIHQWSKLIFVHDDKHSIMLVDSDTCHYSVKFFIPWEGAP